MPAKHAAQTSHEMKDVIAEEAAPVSDKPSWIHVKRKMPLGRDLWFASPKVQLGMVSFVCFLCPGMFNALGGLGGGGKTDATLADNMARHHPPPPSLSSNTALYSTFAVFGFFGGTFVNKLGVKFTLAFGGIGYCIYAISLLVSVHADVSGFNIFAGALLGVCAGLLWTAQGTIMTSYPNEDAKGRYFAWFWTIFNMGAVIGSLIPLFENMGTKLNVTVTDGTYIAFIVLMACGAVLALFLCNANEVIRDDGSKVVLMKNPTWQSELVGLWETIKFEPCVILLFPMFWSSNWFYTYQQNGINGVHFDTRTKALNNLLYYLAQIIGAMFMGYCLDYHRVARSLRAKCSLILLFVMTMVIWGGGYAWQKKYDRADVDQKLNPAFVPTDWTSNDYVGPMFLYMFYGFYDSLWQASVYWYMGALSNSGRRSANYVGFYKGIQSAGAAVMWSLDSRKVSFMAEFTSNWALLSFSLLCAMPVIFFKVQDSVSVEEDLIGTDETIADVRPLGSAEKPDHA
ncbi:DUF895 domain membrane protein [Marssonina coronariae]|uniref:DUF895 domain membrane protein n=1 Tax=Diplocarpon coronariae TaxID=2795749 RepID=A0A218Z684_9HELO|nr:hypothetical protein JHW43_004202 [Diplocarpon mali]OWP03557.1 DUF895 domain membrane protein [Marssonina coronariae]